METLKLNIIYQCWEQRTSIGKRTPRQESLGVSREVGIIGTCFVSKVITHTSGQREGGNIENKLSGLLYQNSTSQQLSNLLEDQLVI